MLKASPLEEMWVLLSVFSPSEVEEPVPPSDLVQVCWLCLVIRDFDYDSMVPLEAMEKFASKAELYFAVKYEKSD